MPTSQPEFERLLVLVRDLTARVHRLEELAGVQPTAAVAPVSAPYSPPTSLSASVSEPVQKAPQPTASSVPKVEVPTPRFKQDDLESRIGSHWLNRVGITAVLIGVSLFLNYAFENNWIGPSARVVIGLFAGIALVLWSERFRKRGYELFSYSLKAVGVGVLYLSLWASFQVYHLLSSNLVFAAMIIVTASTCALAIAQNAEIIAIFAFGGGFATPVLLSTGENHEIILFSYLVLLDLGLLLLIAVKYWRRIAIPGFIGTLAYYLGWYSEFYDRTQLAPTLVFATLFFAIFAAAPLLMVRQSDDPRIPLALAFANGATFFLQGYVMLMDVGRSETAWFTLLLAALYLLLVRAIRPTSDARTAQNLRLLHLALAMGLITVAIPIRLEGHSLTIGWLAEAAALLWVSARLKSDLLNGFAIAALVFGVALVLLFDNFAPATIFFNERMAMFAAAMAVLGYAAYRNAHHKDEAWRKIAAVAVVALNVLALRALSMEVSDYYARQMPKPSGNYWSPRNLLIRRSLVIARDFTYSALWMLYGAMLMVLGFWRASAFVRWHALVLIALTVLKVFIYDTSQLDHVYRILSFIALGILLLAVSFAYQRQWLKLPSADQS